VLRAAEPLLPFAAAGELGRGQPEGHVLRTCAVAMHVADVMGLPPAERADVYFTALLVHAGCTAGSAQFAAFIASDELQAQRDLCLCDTDNTAQVLGWLRRNVAPAAPLPARLGRLLQALFTAESVMGDVDRGCSDVGARSAARLKGARGGVRTSRPMMKIETSLANPEKARADFVALAVWQDALDAARALDRALGGVLLQAAKDEEFTGKSDQVLVVHTHGKIPAARVALVGMGKKEEDALEAVRGAAGRTVKAAKKAGAESVAFAWPAKDAAGEARAAAEGALLGDYRFDRYLKEKNGKRALKTLQLLGVGGRGTEEARLRRATGGGRRPEHPVDTAVALGTIVAESTNMARDWVNEPAGVMTPSRLAQAARDVAREAGLKCTVVGRKEIEKLRMGLFLGVAQGSAQEPQLIRMEYKPAGRAASAKAVALVGKAITFDSGGLSIKPANAMEDMKTDMAGAAAVIAAMRVVGKVKPALPIYACIGTCENMPSGTAYRPGDILRSRLGKTVEVLNTDAEGRLVLGDVLAWANESKPAALVDLATLTGACVVALGPYTAGAFSNDDKLAGDLLAAARSAGEEMWRLPLAESLRDMIKTPFADMKNVGDRWGGAITAALFLKEFVGETPWAHLDVAGPTSYEKERGYNPRGGTGYGVRTLVNFLLSRANRA
jgi:leucyl aminopeptidase